MDWFLRPERWPITPGDWLRAADDMARAPTRMLLDLFEAVTGALVGKELELRSGQGTTRLHLESVAGAHSAPPVALGAWRPGLDLEGLESVEVTARDVELEAGRVDRLTLLAHDVHLEGGLVTHVVAGPVDLAGEVDQATLDRWLADHDVPLTVVLDGDDRATVRVSRWVHGSVSVELDGDQVRFPVHAVWLAGVRLPLVHRWVETRSVTIPELPRRLRVTGVALAPGVASATGVVDHFREPMQLDRVLRAAQTVGSKVVLDRA